MFSPDFEYGNYVERGDRFMVKCCISATNGESVDCNKSSGMTELGIFLDTIMILCIAQYHLVSLLIFAHGLWTEFT